MGKKNKSRACPALGREISSAECGAGRHAGIACPAGCAHDPFAVQNYEALLEAETRLDRRTTQALSAEIGADRVLRLIDEAVERNGEAAANSAMVHELFCRRDTRGRSFAERWLAAGAPELDKDERVFFAGKARMRPALLEIREVRTDGLLRGLDLLEPEAGEHLFLDRRSWARATRFQVLLVWAYPLPHYWRISGSGVAWPEWRGCTLSPVEALHELVAHAGGPGGDAPLAERRAWLAENFGEMPRRIWAVSDARRREMLASVDLVAAWSEYTLGEAEARGLDARLAEANEVYPTDPTPEDAMEGFDVAYDFCLPPQPGDPAERHEVLGRVLACGARWRLEAVGRARLTRLRARFFELLGGPEREASRELVRDIGRQRAEAIAEPDDALVPPRLRTEPERVEFKSYRLIKNESAGADEGPEAVSLRTLEEANRTWPDRNLPALDGLTPRAAVASSPEQRARVVELLKTYLQAFDEARLRGKLLPDPQVFVRELGLVELDVQAPPERPCPPELLAEMEENESKPGRTEGPGLAPLPGRPLTEPEAMERLMAVQGHFPTDDDLVAAWEDACPEWAREVSAWGVNALSDEELDALEVGLALAWAGLGGADAPQTGHRLDRRKMRAAFESAWARFKGLEKAADILPLIKAMNPRQPALQLVIEIRLALDAKRRNEDAGALAYVYMVLAAWLDAALPELLEAMEGTR